MLSHLGDSRPSDNRPQLRNREGRRTDPQRRSSGAPRAAACEGTRVTRSVVLAVVSLAVGLAAPARAAELPPDARKLLAVLDGAHVEQHWPAEQHVDWRTGIPDGKPEHGTGVHTHCSAFVAAIAERLGIYILRPPEHSQVLLANAQHDWLGGAGAQAGWHALADGAAAQAAANRGQFVVVVYRNHRDDKPGHIAIVRPSGKSADALRADGPEITQAGRHNYTDSTVRVGFAGHPAAFVGGEAAYYAHAVDWPRITVAPAP